MSMNPRLLRPRSIAGWSWANGIGSKYLLLNNNGASMTASASANTPGSWVQYIASNAISASDEIQCLHIQAIGNNQVAGEDNSMLMDIATGGSGAEVIIAEGIAVGGAGNTSGGGPAIHVPIRIPGATRVAMRVRAAVGSRVLTVQSVWASGLHSATLFAYALPTAVDVIGTSASTSRGTEMAGASGSWTELTPATTRDYQALVLVSSIAGGFTGAAFTNWVLDLGTGAAGQESQLAYVAGSYTSGGIHLPSYISSPNAIYGGRVPSGTRIAVRHNLASSPERMAACVIGIPYA